MMYMVDGGLVMPERLKTTRNMAKGRREHFTGQFTFGSDEGRTMDVESNTELNVALVTIARPDVVDLEHQVPFQWVKPDGKPATHHFDFRVVMVDGKRRAIMVKSEYRRRQTKVQDELAQIAAQVTPDFADEVVVMSERDLDPIELFNAEIMHEMRRPDPEADASARSVVGEIVASVQIMDLVEAVGLGARGFRALVRLIRSHELQLIDKVRIAHEAYVRRRIQK
ncbi:hypothetical protein FIU89_04910 [Roseovarius sp. THAF27]|uniref:hypothetical protein n=1 Tax=Roseovarius sp. THAF27 TaxID=2587850 RepID=UPI00126955F1|nr:hypothetical protein [Roseovarius sp. THAF27]QFT79944.1 hypothetical protein FIU89_04910 [Roseovarius sp. THAF27]